MFVCKSHVKQVLNLSKPSMARLIQTLQVNLTAASTVTASFDIAIWVYTVSGSVFDVK